MRREQLAARPDAETSPERLFCHCYARGKGNKQLIPGWPILLRRGAGAGQHLVDPAAGHQVRLGPDDDPTEVTAAQLRDVAARLADAGHWAEGDPPVRSSSTPATT